MAAVWDMLRKKNPICHNFPDFIRFLFSFFLSSGAVILFIL